MLPDRRIVEQQRIEPAGPAERRMAWAASRGPFSFRDPTTCRCCHPRDCSKPAWQTPHASIEVQDRSGRRAHTEIYGAGPGPRCLDSPDFGCDRRSDSIDRARTDRKRHRCLLSRAVNPRAERSSAHQSCPAHSTLSPRLPDCRACDRRSCNAGRGPSRNPICPGGPSHRLPVCLRPELGGALVLGATTNSSGGESLRRT